MWLGIIKVQIPNLTDLKQGDSCVNQLLSITHEIYKSFDDEFEEAFFRYS